MIATYARIGTTFAWVLARAVLVTAWAYGLLGGALYLYLSMLRAIRYAMFIVAITW